MDYHDIMSLTETLISTLIYNQFGSYTLEYQGQTLDFKPPLNE